MKKKIVIFSGMVICISLIVLTMSSFDSSGKIIYENKKDSNKIINSNALTMMYETAVDSGEYKVSTENNWPVDKYTFNESLSKCENGSKLSWDDENKRVVMQASTSDRCYVYFDKEPLGNAAEYIASLYTTDGENGLYLHDADLANGANDNSYRYAGSNPNNYVCFGSDEETCPTDNLYRVVGVFNGQVKLIKADYAGSDLLGTDGDISNASYSGIFGESSYYKGSKDQSTIPIYYWNNNTGTNTWSESQLNTVNLNTNYLNALGSEWTDKIATTEWKVGGNTLDNIEYTTPANAYQNEIVSPAEATTYSAKIGLMYVSDYYYGAAPTYWTYHGYTRSSKPNEEGQYGAEYDYRAAINDNWMHMGLIEWTISRYSDRANFAFLVNTTGSVDCNNVSIYSFGVRPSFYLESSVEFLQGDGTEQNPYRVVV